jgi:hypothetical protein
MQNNTVKIHAFAGALSQHICAVDNFTHYVRKWLKANTTENCETIADTLTPNKTVTAVIAIKEFVGFGKNCTAQLSNLTVALDDLLKVVGAA